MIPSPAQALTDLAMKLATGIAPEASSRYAMANAGLISTLMLALAQEFERGVATRMTDIDEMGRLFRRAAEQYPDAPATAQRLEFCGREPASLNLSDVNDLHGDGLTLLIDLHAWAEAHAGKLNDEIWAFLHAYAERTKYQDLPM